VRVFVQNSSTREFLHSLRGWTRNEREALDFQKTAPAVEFCVRERLSNAQLILKFGEDPEFDIILPVRIARVPSTIGAVFAAA
jgi:hypothetical protein